jgi:succinylarginine dihydrolase
MLRTVFGDSNRFVVHEPLPATAALADEGAANHGRICSSHGAVGHHLFVYGREAHEPATTPGGFPRRQSKLAGELIANAHGLDPRLVSHARQSAAAIDAGAFHNDVVSVVNQDVLFAHELAFDQPVDSFLSPDCRVVSVSNQAVPLADAISSYLFNSQLATLPNGDMVLVAPAETAETESTAAYLRAAVADPTNPIAAVETMDLRESMRNGGGPACLRLRVVLTAEEMLAVTGRTVVDEAVLDDLSDWVQRNYRDHLDPSDLADPTLVNEVRVAMAELQELLELPGLYD